MAPEVSGEAARRGGVVSCRALFFYGLTGSLRRKGMKLAVLRRGDLDDDAGRRDGRVLLSVISMCQSPSAAGRVAPVQ